MRRRAVWYYCPTALSEFTLPFLDIAQRQGVLDDMAPRAEHGSDFARQLFGGMQPTAVQFGEQDAFRHYLSCLRAQSSLASGTTFDETIAAHEGLLDAAAVMLRQLHDNGVYGQARDFQDYIDVGRSALQLHRRVRGPVLRRRWANL